MHQRRSLRLLGNSLLLELPCSVFEACHHLGIGDQLELQGSAKRSDLATEEIKLSVTKALHSVCFELKGAQVGQAFEELLHDSWKCIIDELPRNEALKRVVRKNRCKKCLCVSTASGKGRSQDGNKADQVNDKNLSQPVLSSCSSSSSLDSAVSPLGTNHSASPTEGSKQEVSASPETIKRDIGNDNCLVLLGSSSHNESPGGSTESKETASNALLCSACGRDFSLSRVPSGNLVIHQKQYCLSYWSSPALSRCGNTRANNSKKKTDNMPTPGQRGSVAHGRKFASSKNQCAYCSRSFTSRITRNRHEMFVCSQNPNVIKPHTCKLCRRPFHTEDKLMEHMSEKHKGKKHVEQEKTCELCGLMFKRANSLYVHKRTAHKIKEPKYRCPHCSKAFHFRDPYNMHVATHSDERPQLCPNCGKRFKNRDQLLKHRNRIHLNKWPYRCDKCGHGMDTKKCLLTHQCHRARRNPDGSHRPNKYPKKLPKKSTSLDGSSTESLDKRTKVEMPKVACSICGQWRKNNETLLKHIHQQHRDVSNYEEVVNQLNELIRVKCSICCKDFRSTKTLREHMQNVHTVEECACQHCGKVFRTSSHVKAHVKNVHQSTPGRHVCNQCSSVFKSRKNLVWHIRYQHLKLERKYKCPQCDFRYAFDKQYYEHRTRVHGPKRQECPWCGYRCATRWYMNKHMKNCIRGHTKHPKLATAAATKELSTLSDQPLTAEAEKSVTIKSELPDVLMQLEGGQVIIEEKAIDQKQLLEQLAHGALLSQSFDDDDKCTAEAMKPLEQHTIIELPASWNEKTVPENVSLAEITCIDQSAEQLISNDVQQYCIVQDDGSKQIIQLVYADASSD